MSADQQKAEAGSVAATPRIPYTASAFQVHTWGATGISYYFQYQLFALVSIIFNLGFGMDPRLVGWALFFPRLIDAFLDPIIGHFSDIAKTPWGRRRPFMMVCSILAAFLGWALWQANTQWPWWLQFIYLCTMVTLYFIVVMTFELTRNALSFELSDDYNLRSKIMAIASFWSSVPQVLGGAAVYWFVVEMSTGETVYAGFPQFRAGWVIGLLVWLGAASILGFLVGFVMLRSRAAAARWIGGVATCVVLVGAPPAILFALHGQQGAKAMFHSWNSVEQKVAVSQPASTSAPASRADSQTAISAPEIPPASRVVAQSSASNSAPASLPAITTQPASLGTSTWGLDYPGYTFFKVKLPNMGSKVAAIRVIAIIVGGVIILFAILPTIFIKERFQNYTVKHVSLWKAFKATLKNKAFVVMILLRLAQTLGTVLAGNLVQYIIIYRVCSGDQAKYSAVMSYGGALLGLFFTILIWPLAAPVTKLIGKRWGLILGFGTALAQGILAPFLIRPGWIWILFLNNFFWMPFSMMQGVFVDSIKPDICDIDELASGERREGLYSAVYSFINKLEISLVNLISGYLLVWVGFNTKDAAKNVMPPDTVITYLMWWAYTPLIIFAAVGFVLTFFNPLTPEVMSKVHDELEQRRAANDGVVAAG